VIFTEFRFLFFFLVAFSIHWLLRSAGARKNWLLACSYFFYGCWDWRFLFLILASTLVDYFVGERLCREECKVKRKHWLWVSLGFNLGMLGFFKYFHFFTDSAVGMLNWIGLPASSSTLEIILPVGISFYTFQTLSYSLDIYRGKLKPAESLRDFALFVAFFPQLVAGPIVRAVEFMPQLSVPRSLSKVQFRACLTLFLFGFVKKACVGDHVAPMVDQIFGRPDLYDFPSHWLGAFGFWVQLYCDFSGYSDMAIATAGLLGYALPVNFLFPILSYNITDFWRR
jgi:alginate O-acetyltransferase complex protein AlgI